MALDFETKMLYHIILQLLNINTKSFSILSIQNLDILIYNFHKKLNYIK